jgi:hypothetical protein
MAPEQVRRVSVVGTGSPEASDALALVTASGLIHEVRSVEPTDGWERVSLHIDGQPAVMTVSWLTDSVRSATWAMSVAEAVIGAIPPALGESFGGDPTRLREMYRRVRDRRDHEPHGESGRPRPVGYELAAIRYAKARPDKAV